MKVFLYMALVVVFIVIFQQNPLFGVILIAIVAGGCFYIKSRKHGGRMGIMRSGRMPAAQDQTQTLLIYMLLQQLSTNHDNNLSSDLNEKGANRKETINDHLKARDELLQLLE